LPCPIKTRAALCERFRRAAQNLPRSFFLLGESVAFRGETFFFFLSRKKEEKREIFNIKELLKEKYQSLNKTLFYAV